MTSRMPMDQTDTHHTCSKETCCRCGYTYTQSCEVMSSTMVVVASPLMPEVGEAFLCFECSCALQELIHTDLPNDAEYIHGKDQVVAHMRSHRDGTHTCT